MSKENCGKKTLVLDLDETLVHSTLVPVEAPDIKFSVLLDSQVIDIYVTLRPGLQKLLESAHKNYEIIVYTASLSKYADPLLNLIDNCGLVDARLFREHCVLHNGVFVKDLGRLGRDMKRVIIVDVSAK
jgi:RNA polymerase II subunit A small phosphatase-like protein